MVVNLRYDIVRMGGGWIDWMCCSMSEDVSFCDVFHAMGKVQHTTNDFNVGGWEKSKQIILVSQSYHQPFVGLTSACIHRPP